MKKKFLPWYSNANDKSGIQISNSTFLAPSKPSDYFGGDDKKLFNYPKKDCHVSDLQ